MYKHLLAILLAALAAIVSPSAAIAQDASPTNSLEIAGGGTALTDRLGLVEVAPNLFLMPSEVEDLRITGCTGGPNALFSDRDTLRVWCTRASNGDLGRYLRSGARAWFLMMTPAGLQLEIYMKGVNRDPNVRCWGMVGYRGINAVNLTCVNTANGHMFWTGVLGSLISNGGSQALGAAVSNWTAPDAGDSNIIIGQQGTSSSTSNSNGGGAAPNIIIDVTANATGTGGAAGSNSSVVGAPVCPTTTCH
jgi:hypothetical protein